MEVTLVDVSEIERRWQIGLSYDRQTHEPTFEYITKDESQEDLKVATGYHSIRGKLISIQIDCNDIIITTSECYFFSIATGGRLPCETLTLKIPMQEIVPEAYGDMLFLTHETADLIVYGAIGRFN